MKHEPTDNSTKNRENESQGRRKRKRKGGFVFSQYLMVCLLLLIASLTISVDLWILRHHENPSNSTTTDVVALFKKQREIAANKASHNHQNNGDEKRDNNNNNDDEDDDEDRERIRRVFEDAGIHLTDDQLQTLPTWSQIVSVIGEAPVIYGLDTCQIFRDRVPAVERNVGSLGMFNSGTNLVTRLIKENCKIPERVEHYGWNLTFERGFNMGPFEAHGMRWQVPWGKHTAAKYRMVHNAEKPEHSIPKDSCMPVITVRNPYSWMSSMCRLPYSAKWEHDKSPLHRDCPHVTVDGTVPVPLTIRYAEKREDSHTSLVHLWNDWYSDYYYNNFAEFHNKNPTRTKSFYPRLMVRFEDLIFHSRNVTTQVCDCIGGKLRQDRPFYYIEDSAKEGPGHGGVRTGMMGAWIKYGKHLPPRAGFSQEQDYLYTRQHLHPVLMNTFRYQHPPQD